MTTTVHTRINAAYYPTPKDAVDEANRHGAATVYFDRPFDVDDHLYVSGRTSLVAVGDGALNLTQEPTNGSYWIVCGTSDFGATNANGLIDTWTGTIKDLRLTTSFGSSNFIKAINLMNFDGVLIDNVECDFTSDTNATGFVGALNNSIFHNGTETKRNLTIRDCTARFLHAATPGNEFIGISQSNNVTISGCKAYNFGDDFIAMHENTNFSITDNYGEALDGRILVESSLDGVVKANKIERVAHPVLGTVVSGGGLIWVEPLRTTTTAPTSARVEITDNVCVHNDNIVSVTYGIRNIGGKDITIANNVVRGGGGFGFGVEWTELLLPGWTDPTGEEPDSITRVRRMGVYNNRYDADVLSSVVPEGYQGTKQPGPIWRDSNASGPTVDRPDDPINGQRYWDTTVGAALTWDGAAWASSGAGSVTQGFTGDGAATSFGPVNHALNTLTPSVEVYVAGVLISDGWSATITDANNLTVDFGAPPANLAAISVKVTV